MLPFLFSREKPSQCAATWPDSYFLLCCGAEGLQGAAGSSICSSAGSPAPGRAAGPPPGLLSCLSHEQSQFSQTLSTQHLVIPKKAWASHWELGPCHPALPSEPCSLPQTILRLSPHGGWAGALSTWGAACEWVMLLQFSLGRPSCLRDHLMDLPVGGLMCGVFSNAFIPAIHPLFPEADPTGQAPHWLSGDEESSSGRAVFLRMEVGQGQLVWCWCLDCPRLSTSPCCMACAPPWLSRLSITWVSQNSNALSLPVSSTAPGLSPYWFLHPFLSLHCLQTLQQGWVRL